MAAKNEKKRKSAVKPKSPKNTNNVGLPIDPDLIAPVRGLR